MVNYLKTLNNKYNCEIRKSCQEKKQILEDCMKNSFNDSFICENEIISFQKCIADFDISFRKKFNLDKLLQQRIYTI